MLIEFLWVPNNAGSNDARVRGLLADESGVILRGVSRLLESEIQLVGACGEVEETERLAEELQPDVSR
jgi:hypothetical protein